MEELYKMLLQERENDSKRYWTIFSIMNIINAGLLAVITSKDNPDVFLKDIASLFGIILCIIWLFAELRMLGWVKLWEIKIKGIERCYLKEIKLNSESKDLYELGFRIFRHRKNPSRYIAFLSTRWIGWLLPALFAFTWLLMRFPSIQKCLPILKWFIRS